MPSTVLRATQFHEFPGQLIATTRSDSQAHVFDLRVKTVAARTVATVLLELAEGAPAGRAVMRPDFMGFKHVSWIAVVSALREEVTADADRSRCDDGRSDHAARG